MKKLNEKAAERAKYIGDNANKVLVAIEEIFSKATPLPTGLDMEEIMSLVSVYVFARQISMSCNSKKTMQSVFKSTIWALKNSIDDYAEHLIKSPELWDSLPKKEGVEDGRTES